MSLRRAIGSLSSEEFERVIALIREKTRISDQNVKMTRRFFVESQLQVDIANEFKVTRAAVNKQCKRIFESYQFLKTDGDLS